MDGEVRRAVELFDVEAAVHDSAVGAEDLDVLAGVARRDEAIVDHRHLPPHRHAITGEADHPLDQPAEHDHVAAARSPRDARPHDGIPRGERREHRGAGHAIHPADVDARPQRRERGDEDRRDHGHDAQRARLARRPPLPDHPRERDEPGERERERPSPLDLRHRARARDEERDDAPGQRRGDDEARRAGDRLEGRKCRRATRTPADQGGESRSHWS